MPDVDSSTFNSQRRFPGTVDVASVSRTSGTNQSQVGGTSGSATQRVDSRPVRASVVLISVVVVLLMDLKPPKVSQTELRFWRCVLE